MQCTNPKDGAESDNRLIHWDRQYGQEPPPLLKKLSTSGSKPEVFPLLSCLGLCSIWLCWPPSLMVYDFGPCQSILHCVIYWFFDLLLKCGTNSLCSACTPSPCPSFCISAQLVLRFPLLALMPKFQDRSEHAVCPLLVLLLLVFSSLGMLLPMLNPAYSERTNPSLYVKTSRLFLLTTVSSCSVPQCFLSMLPM